LLCLQVLTFHQLHSPSIFYSVSSH
jgi:hypothetical protein